MDIDVVSCTPAPHFSFDQVERATTSSSSAASVNNEKRYFCQRCLNHRLEFPRKGHKPYCQYAKCTCEDCRMVEDRRVLNNQLSRRKLDPNAPRSNAGTKKVRDPKCARCSAHGKDQALRGHKRALCPFSDCRCKLCKLVENRRSLMARQIKLRRDQQKARKAQQNLDEAEDEIRRSIDLNLDSPTEPSIKIPSPKPKIQRNKSKTFVLYNLLKMQMNERENLKPENGIFMNTSTSNSTSSPSGSVDMGLPKPIPLEVMERFKKNNELSMNFMAGLPHLDPASSLLSPRKPSPQTVPTLFPTSPTEPPMIPPQFPLFMNQLKDMNSLQNSFSSNLSISLNQMPMPQPKMPMPFMANEWMMLQQQQKMMPQRKFERPVFPEATVPDVIPVSTTFLQHLITLASKNSNL